MELEKLVEQWAKEALTAQDAEAMLEYQHEALTRLCRLAMAHAAEEAIQICDDRLHNGDVTTGALHENTAIREAIRERFKA